MRALIVLVMSAGFVDAVAAAPSQPSQMSVESPSAFVETYAGRPVRQAVTLLNDSDESVKLIGTQSANTFVDLISADPSSVVIPAHSSKDISLEFTSCLVLGAHRLPFDFLLLGDSGNQIKVRGNARVFIQSVFDLDHPEIDFGVVKAEDPTTKSLQLSSSDIPDIKLTQILEAPEFLTASVTAGGAGLSATTRAGAPWGLSDGFIKLKTNSELQPEVWVHYQIDVRGDVVSSQNPVNFSPDNVGAEQEQSVRLTRTAGKPLQIRSVSTTGIAFGTRVDECAPAAVDCKLLRIVLPAETVTGLIKGHVTLSFEGLKQELPIQIGGFRLAKGQKFKSLTDNATTQRSASPTPKEPLDIGKVIDRENRNAAPLPAPEGRGPLLKWSVAHEGAVYGYAVYRGNSDAGPFLRVSRETIRASEDEEQRSDYQWRDTSAEPGKTYWYYVAALQNDGHKRKLSDPQKVVAK
jgi:hypothetical protein